MRPRPVRRLRSPQERRGFRRGPVHRANGLVDEAARSSVVVALENTRKTEAIDRALSAIGSPHLGFCYDSSHDFLYAQHPTEILRHWIPGMGTIDWGAIKDALPKPRPLPLSIEVVPVDPGSQSAETFLQESMERGRALARMLTGGQA